MSSDHDLGGIRWDWVRLLEKLGEQRSRQLLSAHLSEARRRARDELQPLEPWDECPASSFAVYRDDANHVRLHRVLDFLQPDDRVLDVGYGHGYLTGVVVGSEKPSYYAGIDVDDKYIERVHGMARTNNIDASGIHLYTKSIYDVDCTFIDNHRPDIVLLLEVLEHVADAELALKTLANSMTTGHLLVTVPLLGRLESCWGHESLFNEQRVRDMFAGAGLEVSHVEPLYNTWVLVLANKGSVSRVRANSAKERSIPLLRANSLDAYEFERVEFSDDSIRHRGRWVYRVENVRIWSSKMGICCSGEALHEPGGEGAPYLGLAFDIPDIEVLRFDLKLQSHVVRLFVDFEDGHGNRLVRWQWNDVPHDDRIYDSGRTFVLRRTLANIEQLQVQVSDLSSPIARVQVFSEINEGGVSGFCLQLAAFVPMSSSPQ